jgi:integrase
MITALNMRLYQYRGIWHIALPGNVRRSLKTRDKQIATRLHNKIKKEILLGNIIKINKSQQITLSNFIKEYLEYSKAEKRHSTYLRDKYSLNKLLENIGNRPLKSITSKILDKFHVDLINAGHKTAGVAITARHCRAALNRAVSWDYIKASPYNRTRKIKVEKRPPRFYTEDELKKIFNAISNDQNFYDLIKCYLLTGMRRKELFSLQRKHVDLINNTITIVESKTDWRVIEIDEELKDILERRCKKYNIGRLFPMWKHPDAITHRWVRLMKRLNIQNARLHDLRHSTASYLIMAGVDIRTIQNILGHSDISTTRIYTHLAPGHMKKAFAKLKNLHRISNGQYPKIEINNK